MINYIVRRSFYSILLMVFSATLIFFIVHAAPGSPYARMVNEYLQLNPRKTISATHLERLDRLIGLDKSIGEQYLLWTRNVFTGSLGQSWSVASGVEVFDVIMTRLPYTLILMVSAAVFSFLVAVPLGAYSALHQYSTADMTITTISYFGIAMPTFWFGLVLISIFSSGLHWLPWGGAATQQLAGSGDMINVLARIFTLGLTNSQIAGKEALLLIDGLKHLILPTLVLSFLLIARWTRYLRSSMLETLNLEYVRTARAKGVSEKRVIMRHTLRNAMIPLLTAIALDIPILFASSFIIENVFNWPGIGRLFVESLKQADWPMMTGILIINAFLIILFNFTVDLFYPALDPRIVYS